MKKLILLLIAFLVITPLCASGKNPDDIKGKWYLKSIVIDGLTRDIEDNYSSYIYFTYDSTKRFIHLGSFQIVNGKEKFEEYASIYNYYQISGDSIKFVGPRIIDKFIGSDIVTFDLCNELYGAFNYSINSNLLQLKNEKLSLNYEKDTVFHTGLKKVVNSPDFGFDKRLIGTWNLIKMAVSDSILKEVDRNIEKSYQSKRNQRFLENKSPKELIATGKQRVRDFIKNGGWIVYIGDFVDNTCMEDSSTYGNRIGFRDGCNSYGGYIRLLNSTLKTNNIMRTLVSCFPNFTETFKNTSVFDYATYHFNGDTLIIKAKDRTSFFLPAEQTIRTKRYKSNNLNKHYRLIGLDIEDKDLERTILNLIPENEIYFQINGGWGVNSVNKSCSGKQMRIFLYNNKNYYMQYILTVFHENYKKLQDTYKYNCTYYNRKNGINKFLDLNLLLGDKYSFNIEGNNLTFKSLDGSNFLYLKSNY